MSFDATVLTLYPEMFPGFLAMSMAGRALEENIWSLTTMQIRDYAHDRHHSVDDTPAGGGAGMVMKPDVLARAVDAAPQQYPRYLLSPRGRQFSQQDARKLADSKGVVLVCGRFEGVDQRVIDSRNLIELSIGDYILSGGETAAFVILDAVVRLLPGVMGNALSAQQESFENGLLEHPHYTRPQVFDGLSIPEVLRSGNHRAIASWQHQQSLQITKETRPDLYAIYQKSKQNS